MTYGIMLDIGGGLAPEPGFINLDPVHGRGEYRRRIQDGIPLGDRTVARARCSHLMEHIPAGKERIDAFNEVWRVLVHGSTFEIIVPLLIPGRWEAIADPTHVSYWVKESFDYFTHDIEPAADYSIRRWEWVSWSTFDRWAGFPPMVKYPPCEWEGHALLRKP